MVCCIVRTSTANKPLPLYLGPKQLSVSSELNPARVKASKKKYLVYIPKILVLQHNNGDLIQWTSGYTGLGQRNRHGFDTDKRLRASLRLNSSSPFPYVLKIFIFFLIYLSRIFY
jgi:hypothetical protein